MKLTHFERTVLAHQCRQRQVMEPNNGDFWLLGAEAFERGYESEYQEYMVDKEPVNEADLNEVSEILFMFRVLNHAKSKEKFAGFDGNDPHEVKLLGYVRYLWKQDSFKESDHGGNDGGNSHMEMLPVYRRMLEAYKKDPKNIKAIEDAAIHPRNR
jgi:uncharacterized protein YfbU (UPF0304 family)